MKNRLVLWSCFFGLTSVILGAFGAHGLENQLTFSELDSFETATLYQLVHSILLFSVASSNFFSIKIVQRVGQFLVAGILLFSFSIYALTLDQLIGLDLGFLGPVTPFGGLCLILAWGTMVVATIRQPK